MSRWVLVLLGGLSAEMATLRNAAVLEVAQDATQPPSPTPQDKATEVTELPVSRNLFVFPVRLDDASRGRLKEIRLLLSRDKGKTWKVVDTMTRDNETLRFPAALKFNAPEDGRYWFAVQTVDNDGQVNPAVAKIKGEEIIGFLLETKKK